MNKPFLLILLCVIAGSLVTGCNQTNHNNKQEQDAPLKTNEESENSVAVPDTIRGSIPSEAQGTIGDVNISINYYAPGVKGRILWGGLVPYDQVWATGAHMATSVAIDKNLYIAGKEVPAGKYALFTIPGREEWTVIINRDWQQHLADKYDQKKDVLRIQIKPTRQNQHQERLRYEVKQLSNEKGSINMSWDDLRIEIPVSTGPN